MLSLIYNLNGGNMNFKKLSSFLTIAILSLVGFKAYAADVHGVFCGSDLRPNYVEIAD